MALSTIVTVFCNGCGRWDAVGHTAAEARREARRLGWTVSVPGTDTPPEGTMAQSMWQQGKPRDFCPDCAPAVRPPGRATKRESPPDRRVYFEVDERWVVKDPSPETVEAVRALGRSGRATKCE